MKGRKLSRRDILQGAAALTTGAVFASPVRAQAPEPVAITPDLVEAAKHYPCEKRRWVEFLGEHPNPATERVE